MKLRVCATGDSGTFTELDAIRSHLTMSDTDKGKELAVNYGPEFLSFLEQKYPELYSGIENAEEINNYEDFFDYDGFGDIGDNVLAEFFTEFAMYGEVGAEAPTFMHMEFMGDVEDEWLVHLTDYSSDILSDGFTKGMGEGTGTYVDSGWRS